MAGYGERAKVTPCNVNVLFTLSSCFVGLLSVRAYKCICLLCNIIDMITKPMVSIEEVATLHRLLNEHHILFVSVYGKWEV